MNACSEKRGGQGKRKRASCAHANNHTKRANLQSSALVTTPSHLPSQLRAEHSPHSPQRVVGRHIIHRPAERNGRADCHASRPALGRPPPNVPVGAQHCVHSLRPKSQSGTFESDGYSARKSTSSAQVRTRYRPNCAVVHLEVAVVVHERVAQRQQPAERCQPQRRACNALATDRIAPAKASPVDRERHHPGLGCQHERLRQPHRSVVNA